MTGGSQSRGEPITAGSGGPRAVAQARRAALIRRVVRDTMARRDRGEAVPAREVEAAHRELMPELARELALLELVERARAEASAPTGPALPRSATPINAADGGFDGYEVLREAHRGGQGVVFEAIQRSTGRRVAIKVMREGLFAGEHDAPRFEREVRILGQLSHPGIVGILASGVRGGHFYYAMEFVEGEPIDRWVEGRRPDAPDVLRLFAGVCDAVAAAHVRGIIHRDLKPANILVDERGGPRILDFGLARIVTESDAVHRMTVTGQFVGSMPWASPEQASGDQSKVDVRTDVYSLGVILYQLLTGRFPYAVEGSPRDVLDNILTAEPARPRSLVKGLDEDAEAIVLKCLAKERDRRYQSASELADDLRRAIEGRAVIARPPSVSYQIRALARRHRALVAGAGAVLGALVLGLIGTSIGLIEASAARRGLKGERDAALAAEKDAERGRAEAERQSYVASIAAADAALRALDAGTAQARLAAAPERLRGWEWSHLMALADRSIGAIPGEYLGATPTPEGDGIVVVRTDGTASLLAADTLAPRWTATLPISTPRDDTTWRLATAFSPGGRVAIGYGPEVFIVEVASGRLLRRCAFEAGEYGFIWLAFSPDGESLAANGVEGHLRVWEIDSGRELFRLGADRASSGIAYSPDGRFLWIDTARGVEFLDAGTFQTARRIDLPLDPAEYGQLKVTPDGGHLVVVRGFSPIVVDAETGRVTARCEGHTQRTVLSGFTPDGRLITCSWDRTIRLWDTTSGRQEGLLLGHSGTTCSAGFFAGGTRIISASTDGTLRIWDAAIAPDVQWLPVNEGVWTLGFAAEGRELRAQSFFTIQRWESGSWDELPRYPLPFVRDSHAGFSPDGRWIAHAPEPGTVLLYDTQARRSVSAGTEGVLVRKLSFSPDSRSFVAALADGQVRVFTTPDATPVRSFTRSHECGAQPVFLPGTPHLVVPEFPASLLLCDPGTGRVERFADPGLPRTNVMLSAACSPDGRLIASGHAGGIVLIWDTRSRAPVRRLTGMDPAAWCVAFSPDGTRLATGSQDRMVRVWDPADGTELLVLRGHKGTVMALAWSPDGRTLASGGYDDVVLRWDAR